MKVQKSSVYFVHNFNKLQQLKLSAVWILAISLRILIIIITNMASSYQNLSLYAVLIRELHIICSTLAVQ